MALGRVAAGDCGGQHPGGRKLAVLPRPDADTGTASRRGCHPARPAVSRDHFPLSNGATKGRNWHLDVYAPPTPSGNWCSPRPAPGAVGLGGGHLFILESAAEIAELVADFLRDQPPPG